MWYLFNKQNQCFGTISGEPNHEDLATRNEFAVESDLILPIEEVGLDAQGDVIQIIPEIPREQEITTEIQSIDNQLAEIDRLSIRPLRAIMKGVGTDADINRLHELEDKAEQLRARRAALVEELTQLTGGA